MILARLLPESGNSRIKRVKGSFRRPSPLALMRGRGLGLAPRTAPEAKWASGTSNLPALCTAGVVLLVADTQALNY